MKKKILNHNIDFKNMRITNEKNACENYQNRQRIT